MQKMCNSHPKTRVQAIMLCILVFVLVFYIITVSSLPFVKVNTSRPSL